MDQQIEAVTETLRQHRTMLKRITHPRNDRWLMNITACTGCDWTSELLNAEAEDAHAAHVAALILASFTEEWGAQRDGREVSVGLHEPMTRDQAVAFAQCSRKSVPVRRLVSPWVVVEEPR